MQVAEILELSVSEKLRIVGDIWDSISASPDDLPISEAEKRILDERLEQYRNDPDKVTQWETFKKELRSK